MNERSCVNCDHRYPLFGRRPADTTEFIAIPCGSLTIVVRGTDAVVRYVGQPFQGCHVVRAPWRLFVRLGLARLLMDDVRGVGLKGD